MTKTIFKKVITMVAMITIIGAIITISRLFNNSKINIQVKSNNDGGKAVINSQLTKLQGKGMQKVAENSNLSLSVDFSDGNIEVLNKKNGYVWRSKPTEGEISKEKSNELWKQNITSPIVFDYVDDYTSIDSNVGNVYNQNTEISVYKLDNGARVYFNFKASGIKIAYDLVLQNDNLEVLVPSNLISEPGAKYIVNTTGSKVVDESKTVLLTNFSVFPFLGATRSDGGEKGYLFLPDGPGALMRFETNKGLNSQFVGSVYGTDLSYLNNYDSTIKSAMNEAKILFPVFGIVRDNNSLMAVIDKGDSNADIIGSPAGTQTGFNTAYASYRYREKYKVITSPSDGNGYFRYTASAINGSRAIRYYFNCNDEANYVGMAQTYRNYLMETKGIKKQEDTGKGMPLQLNIYGGTMKQNFIGKSFVTMTTFKQAQGIVNFFKHNNVKNMDITYEGWGTKGDPVEYLSRLPAANSLGGNSGLNSFVNYAHDSGYKVYLQDDNITAVSKRGISLKNNTITNVLGDPLDYDGYFLNINTTLKFLNKSIVQYKKYGIDGIEEDGIGTFLNTDFNKNNPLSRNDMENAYVNILKKEKNSFNSLRISSGMAYELSNNSTIVNMPMDGSYLTVIDETVPFYEIALHGIVNYDFGDYNQFSDPELQFLEAVEYGGNVSFIVSAEPTQLLRDVKGNRQFSTESSIWDSKILSQYKRISVLNYIKGQYITGFKNVTPNVSVVTYGNNAKVVCNFANHSFTYEGRTVESEDFILIKG